MKITIEAEEGDINVEGYPVTLVKVHEFIIVGHAVDPAGQRTEFKHLRTASDSVSLRSLAWGAIEYLREQHARLLHTRFHGPPKQTEDANDGGNGPK